MKNKEDFFDPLNVKIKLFEGPLDLLLHLIRNKKLSIQKISLAELCEPFLEYVKNLKSYHLDNLGQFIYIASVLIVIKTRNLLPQSSLEKEQEENPEAVLRKQLLEYDEVRKKRELLEQIPTLYKDIFPRSVIAPKRSIYKQLQAISIPDLLGSYKNIIENFEEAEQDFHLPDFAFSTQSILQKILLKFTHSEFFSIDQLFLLFTNLQEKIIAFLLLLEAGRLNWLRIEQKFFLSDIIFFPSEKFSLANEKEILL